MVYYTTKEWARLYQEVASMYFSCKSSMYHYYGTANKNYQEHLRKDLVKYKKYFYVLRPILVCKWIEEKRCPPPVRFEELFHSVLEEDLKESVEDLLKKKVQMSESEKAPKIEKINEYIEKNLVYYKQLLKEMVDDKKTDWEPLEKTFREMVDSGIW